ncbi:solute carrier family 23 member 2-like [Gigantopelta aegis]|uniref:solute carrier family 23 member 2-like n=1 Tax=Gigantopelta aegis TaxID=1735272 RepID=UPI001B88AB2F|nr:solute carrier family 23 member 2-like [Gigantopelta aegis]
MEEKEFLEQNVDTGSTDPSTTRKHIVYGIHQSPHPLLWPVFGLQQALMCITGTLSLPFLIANQICAHDMPEVRSQLLSISFFMCGIATLLQNVIGIRLPIIQGGSMAFLIPIMTMMNLDQWKCRPRVILSSNSTSTQDFQWMEKMREIQGNLMLASLTQVFLGATGLVGFLLRFIGPLTIAPTVSLIGLSLAPIIIDMCALQWGISAMSLLLVVLSSLVLGKYTVPFPICNRKKKCHVIRYPVFQLAPVLLSICITWMFCFILTASDVFPTNSTVVGYEARTDTRLFIVSDAPYFYFPYPFQFGMPTFSAAGFFGMLMATIASVIESLGDYFAAARICGVPPPPPHAVNRGIAIEGVASVLCGMMGNGHGTTSYCENIGAIAITKMASRRVFETAGLLLVLCGIVGKVGAVLSLIPDPVVGGVQALTIGMVTVIGLSTLKFVDLGSARNLTVMGIAIIMGISVPRWIQSNPNVIDTGNSEADQILVVLLGMPTFVGGALGCILDNVLPGTDEERGMKAWRADLTGHLNTRNKTDMSAAVYDLPLVTPYLRRIGCCVHVPVSPTFSKQPSISNCLRRLKSRKRDIEESVDHTHELERLDSSGDQP